MKPNPHQEWPKISTLYCEKTNSWDAESYQKMVSLKFDILGLSNINVFSTNEEFLATLQKRFKSAKIKREKYGNDPNWWAIQKWCDDLNIHSLYCVDCWWFENSDDFLLFALTWSHCICA